MRHGILNAIRLALETALVAGAFAIGHLARARLGANRWLVYHNAKWEAAVPVQAFAYVALALLLVALAAVVVSAKRLPRKSTRPLLATALAAVLVAVYGWLAIGSSPASNHGYYPMALCLFLAGGLQLAGAALLVRRSQPKRAPART